MPSNVTNLTHSTSLALGWVYVGAIARLILGFGTGVVLARILGPKPFGEIAVATLLFGLGNILSGLGVTSALIQKPEISQRDIRICFTSQFFVGSLISVLLFFSAPVWAIFFRQPELRVVLIALAPIFLFQSLGTTATALLSRAQNTRPIQLAQIISYSFAYCVVAVPMAFLGFGVWSLVAAYLVQAILNSALLYLTSRHSVHLLVDRDGIALIRFGIYVLVTNICNWGISNLDNTVVGRFSGQVSLGLYSRAFNFAQMPADLIVGNLQAVMLPAFSRVQDDQARLARVYLALFGLVVLILLSPFLAMATVPDIVISGLYGVKWSGAIPLFRPLALALPVHALMALAGPTLWSRGKPRIELWIQLSVLLLAIPAFILSINTSLVCLAWTVMGLYCVRFLLMTHTVLRELGVEWKRLIGVAVPGLLLATVAATFALLTSFALPHAPAPIRLLVVAVSSCTLTLVVAFVARRHIFDPILRDTPQIRDILYSRVGRIKQYF
jgi:O-antigen/teichoic acid export membrane protein